MLDGFVKSPSASRLVGIHVSSLRRMKAAQGAWRMAQGNLSDIIRPCAFGLMP
jgi:hypothetical protein